MRSDVQVRPIQHIHFESHDTARHWRVITAWGWSTLVLAVLGIVMFLPIVWMIAGGFKTEAEVTQVPPVLFPGVWHWDNFTYVVATSPITTGYINSIIYVFAIVVIQVTTSTVGGYVFAKLRFPGRNVLLIGILATLM